MSKQIQLDIPSPCSENWEKMHPAEKGRFCDSCQKQVIDFTAMDEQQLAAFFTRNNTPVCGRMRKGQLGQDIAIPRSQLPWFRYFLQIAIPAVLFSGKTQAQGRVVMGDTILVQTPQDPVKIKIPQPDTTFSREISGRIVGPDGQGVEAATVMLINTSQGTAADKNGFFKIRVDKPTGGIRLRISSVGYVIREIDLQQQEINASTFVMLERVELEEVFAGAVVITSKRKKVVPELIRPVMDTLQHLFRVFPNPVSSGTSVNIEWMSELKEGYYEMLMIDQEGKFVLQRQLWIDEKARV